MMHGLQLELKVAGILGKLAREDDARDKQQQRRHQHKAADDQSREARHKAGPEILAQHRDHKADAEHGQDRGQNAEKAERAVVLEQPRNRAQYFKAVGVGVQLALRPFRAVTVVNDNVLDLHIALQGVDRHLGLDLKPAGQYGIGLFLRRTIFILYVEYILDR